MNDSIQGPPMPDDPMSLAELMVLSRLKTGVKYWIDGATDMPEYIFSGGIKRMAQEILNHRWALEQDELKRTEELSEAYNRGFQEAQALYE